MNDQPRAISIDPDKYYESSVLEHMLGINRRVLVKARAAGALRCIRLSREVLYLGSTVRKWLSTLEEPATATTCLMESRERLTSKPG